jgi:hypothetical protein
MMIYALGISSQIREALSLEAVQRRLTAHSLSTHPTSMITQSIFFLSEGISLQAEQ